LFDSDLGSILRKQYHFTNDLDNGNEYTLNKFADNTQKGGVVDTLERCAAIQRDLDRLEKCAHFNKEKCKVLHLGRNNTMSQYMLGANQLERSFAEKALEALVDISQQCALVAKKTNGIPGCNRSVNSQSREVILHLYSVLVRSHQQYCVLFCVPQYRRDMAILAIVQ